MDESARLIFLRSLEIGMRVRVPILKGQGTVVQIAQEIRVDMETGPYACHQFDLTWDEVYDPKSH